MFRHYRVILRELVINTLPSYTNISNAAVGNTISINDVSHRFNASSHITVVEISNIIKNLRNIKMVLITIKWANVCNPAIKISCFKSVLHLYKKGKGHPCTGTEALYRPYDP
jgi:hypothetical protein